MLSSTVWGGISGLAAVVTLAIMIYDRKSRRHSDILRTAMQMCGFFVLGALHTPILMTVAFIIGDGLSWVGVEAVGGHLGEVALRLGLFRLGPWGFNLSQGIISLQLGALALWLGGLLAGMAGVVVGHSVNYDIKQLNRAWLIMPFFSIVFTILIAVINVVINSV